jgi:hypothetical protein
LGRDAGCPDPRHFGHQSKATGLVTYQCVNTRRDPISCSRFKLQDQPKTVGVGSIPLKQKNSGTRREKVWELWMFRFGALLKIRRPCIANLDLNV